MSGTTLAIIIVVAVVIVLLIVYFAMRRRRTQRAEEHRERTREEFGGEYDRRVEEHGDEEEAERELRRRRSRVERQVEPLSDEARGRYDERWNEVERVFVENPERSVELADRTVADLLEERNFVSDPAQSEGETERDLATMHPEIADDYREARRLRASVVARGGRSAEDEERSGEAGHDNEESTEELRQTIRKYRVVYEKLTLE
jgi:hypothetical protein